MVAMCCSCNIALSARLPLREADTYHQRNEFSDADGIIVIPSIAAEQVAFGFSNFVV